MHASVSVLISPLGSSLAAVPESAALWEAASLTELEVLATHGIVDAMAGRPFDARWPPK